MSQFHDSKAKEEHELFFFKCRHYLKKYAPQLSDRPVVLISDREFRAEEAKQLGTNVNLVYCWNHLIQNLKRQAQSQLRMIEADITAVTSDFRRLLKQKSEEQYLERRDQLFRKEFDDEGTEIWKVKINFTKKSSYKNNLHCNKLFSACLNFNIKAFNSQQHVSVIFKTNSSNLNTFVQLLL